MALRDVEAAILAELRELTGNRRIRQKDIMEWSTGEVKARADQGELYMYLPGYKVHVAYKLPPKKSAKVGP